MCVCTRREVLAHTADYSDLIDALLAEGITPFVTCAFLRPMRASLTLQCTIGTIRRPSKSDTVDGEIRKRLYWTLSDMRMSALRRLEIECRIGEYRCCERVLTFYRITINEPYVITIPGWYNGDCAPGRSSDRSFSKEGDSATEPWM